MTGDRSRGWGGIRGLPGKGGWLSQYLFFHTSCFPEDQGPADLLPFLSRFFREGLEVLCTRNHVQSQAGSLFKVRQEGGGEWLQCGTGNVKELLPLPPPDGENRALTLHVLGQATWGRAAPVWAWRCLRWAPRQDRHWQVRVPSFVLCLGAPDFTGRKNI